MRQVLPIVGGIVGGMFGAPQIGFMIGSIIGNIVDPQIIKGPSIGDGQTQTSQEGVPRPIVYGTACVSGNIIDTSKIYKTIKRTRQGKGGPITEEERLSLTYAIRICEGPIDAVIRIWEDDKLVYDVRSSGSQVTSAENTKYAKKFRAYLGTETQNPDPELESLHGVGNTPAYRGTAYIVFPRNDVTDRRGSIPNYRFEVSTSSTVSTSYANMMASYSDYYYFNTEENSITYIESYNNGYNSTGTGHPKISPDGAYAIFKSTSEYAIFKFNTATGRYDINLMSWSATTTTEADWHNIKNIFIKSNGTNSLQVYECVDDSVNLITTQTGLTGFGYIRDYISWNSDGTKFIKMGASTSGYGIGDFSIITGVSNFNYISYLANGFDTRNGFMFSETEADLIYASYVSFPAGRLVAYRLGSGNTLTTIASKSWSGEAGGAGPFFLNNDNIYRCTGTSAVLKRYLLVNESDGVYPYKFITLANPDQPSLGISNSGSGLLSCTDWYNKYIYLPCGKSSGTDKLIFSIYKKNSDGTINLIYDGRADNDSTAPNISYPTATGAEVKITNINNNNVIVNPGQYYLYKIIEDISDRCKLDIDNLNLTDISDILVNGFVIAQQYPGKNAIRILRDSFFFDASEYDKKINFIKRGGNAIETLTIDNLVDSPYDANRKSAIEYPRKLSLIYQNSKIGYDTAKATVERESSSVNVNGENTIEVSVVFTEDEAIKVAEKQLKIAWAEAQGEFIFSIPAEFDYYVNSDIFGINLRNNTERMRIEKIERADGILKLTCKIDRQSAYTSNLTALPLPTPTPPPPTITGDTEFVFLNIPALVDNNDVLGYYYAVAGSEPAWYGALVQRKLETTEYEDLATINSGSTMGYLTESIASSDENYVDTTNIIKVQLYTDYEDLQQITTEQLLRENNAIAISRADGTAEIIQFRDVNDLGNGLYELSYLIRGRLNTKATSHAINSKLVYLDNVNISLVDSSLIGQELTHRAISFEQDAEDADEYINDFDIMYMQYEFPVDELSAEYDSLDPTLININWIGRERFGTDITPIKSLNWVNYEIEVTDGTNTIISNTVNENITVDISTLSPSTAGLTVNVYQINRITGRGEVASITI